MRHTWIEVVESEQEDGKRVLTLLLKVPGERTVTYTRHYIEGAVTLHSLLTDLLPNDTQMLKEALINGDLITQRNLAEGTE